ncbi:uncharacterized protein L201_002751 [Kwoniella dendrophila CBS 6074]|uniref:Uncharacterized protein n=1 Tax=Kwoniella dendrophila CBS 6074 TaxID=1295534 RepID=A0AAX4JR85_9TREE
MVQFTTLFLYLVSSTLITSVLAKDGHIVIKLPKSTAVRTEDIASDQPPKSKDRVQCSFNDKGEGSCKFDWYGPVKESSVDKISSRAWLQHCDIWVDPGFDEDELIFKLKDNSAGLEGDKNEKAHIKCDPDRCFIDNCAIPVVNSDA